MSAKKVDAKEFDTLINAYKPVLVDFFATWCGPCQMMEPIIEEIAKEARDFEVLKIDIDQAPELAAKYNVMGVPTFIVFKNGKEMDRIAQAVSKDILLEKIRNAKPKTS